MEVPDATRSPALAAHGGARMPTRTYLEQNSPHDLRPVPSPSEDVTVVPVEDCAPSLWQRLYKEVGAAYHWVDRLGWTDDDIRAYLADPAVSLWMLLVNGGVAGYFELRKHPESEARPTPNATDDSVTTTDPVVSGFRRTFSVEIAYFGLLPAFVGRGLGKYLLSEAAERAWEMQPSRVWLHTSTLDHAAALPNYLARGFSIVRTEDY
jgi:GNAT superfamily N-acetyltransferase